VELICKILCISVYLLCHEGDVDGLFVEFSGHARRLADVAAIHKPKAGRHGRREGDAVVDEGERRRAGYVLPLRARRPACDRELVSGARGAPGGPKGPRGCTREASKALRSGGETAKSRWRANWDFWRDNLNEQIKL